MSTTFSGPVVSTNGFTGALTGNVTGNVTGNATGNVTGNLTGLQIMPTVTAYTGADAGTLAISPAIGYASMTKASAGAYTLAAPGAGNVGKRLTIICGTANAHVVTVTGGAGGNTLTFTNVVGASAELLAVSATVWGFIGLGGAVLSTV
jgi:hypothetical protein